MRIPHLRKGTAMFLRISMFSVSILLGTMAHARADQVLLAFGKNTDLASIEVHDAKLALRGLGFRLPPGTSSPGRASR